MKKPVEPQEYSENIFFDGTSYFQNLLECITNAQSTIDLETYMFAKDELGQQFIDELAGAAKRGVQVRVLVDSAGTPNWAGSFPQKLEKANVETRVFHPFPWRLWQWSRSVIRKSFLQKMVYLLLKINSRNHRKICIIDNNIAYIGSFNINKCHLNRENGGDGWRDTGICMTGEMSALTSAFEAAWNHMPAQERLQQIFKHIAPNPIIRLNNTRHLRRVLYKSLLRRISKCKTRIWITNAYFVPDNFLLKKLREAAENGVDVRILLPWKSDVFIMPWASTTFYRSLLIAGVRIFEYLPSMLHAKSLILDQWISIGSSNLNYRSLLHDLEVDVNLRLPTSKQAMERQFLKDLTNSKEIILGQWKKRPLYQRIIGRLLLYVKYWI